MTSYRKKLIEVALPLEAINEASAREKYIRYGHPSTLHLWWARRPLAAVRAVIFSSLVDDPNDPNAPSEFVAACRKLSKGKNAAEEDTPRQRLFDFIERLVTWEATTDDALLEQARELIRLSTDGNPPPLLDPFAGGGSIPLEAQRLGLEAHASDLNPVAVMINKAMIEIPPKFADMPPVNPDSRKGTAAGGSWKGAAGLAADVRYYGKWMKEIAWKRIGDLYPQFNGETIVAWIWARTVHCPNPACGATMPLVRSFDLSRKKGKKIWVEYDVNKQTREIKFNICQREKGSGPKGTVNRSGATCIACETPVSFDYIRSQGKKGKLGTKLMAIITEGVNGRNYHDPTRKHEEIANTEVPEDAPETDLPTKALGFRVQLYGMNKHKDLFTPRQLTALTTFSKIVSKVREKIQQDAIISGLSKDETTLSDGGTGARAYADAISLYLGMALSRHSNRMSTLCFWDKGKENIQQVFARHALPMTWDFTEANPFSHSSGNWTNGFKYICLSPLKIL